MRRALRWMAGLRTQPRYFWVALLLSLALLVAATQSAVSGHVGWSSFQVTIAVLAIAAATLLATLPMPAKLWVERQYELGVDDVIFYLYDEPFVGEVPRDILFQVHVAVANLGGRKAVLSALRIEALLDGAGSEIPIPGLEFPILAQRVQQGGGWRIEDRVMHHYNYLDFIPGPHILEPDEVITMRLRFRPGIDWSQRWNLKALREMCNALQRPIMAIRVTAIYRRGRSVMHDSFKVDGLQVLQQDKYAARVSEITNDFRARPTVEERAITD